MLLFSNYILIVILFLYIFSKANALICYNCTATLSPDTDPQGQMALRLFLDATYNVPPVHRLCNLESDVEFKTIPTSQCSNNDNCMKITAENNGIMFVIRGCQSQIYRPNVGIQKVDCRTNQSPSICYCSENLCNASPNTQFVCKILLFITMTIFLLHF